ncbi:acyltransferase [Thermomonas sp. RSS23]|uniref:Acyltransferase n=1 Tax=Thermomonas beijingensis TaxID=2872701 RepID=A0ABS7TCL2_9GAMM|nr:acyltransferase family protein [Thermomonas beijingensis]MBZ4185589.1 acyltransferase [Thermomonas beijingensis]
MTTLAYRKDIDGLRAIAVLAVVLYHYGIGPLHGGFVGVDIFFVISGYLITGIINKEIEQGSFTFSGFYERRIRRIFPALFAMLFATLAVGAWLLLPSDLVRLGNSTVATLLFGSNILFRRQSGYFDTSSEYNPLLHTWSLAVEEQFYIGLPILLLLLHRFMRGEGLKLALLICAVVSFVLCFWVQLLRPTATFFLAPFRAWELLLGSLLAVGALPPLRHAVARTSVSWLALAALLWSLWWIKTGAAFPGWQAAIPVLATAGLLHAGAHGGSPVQRLLSVRPVVFIGLISYSLYLWHWPLLVFVRYRNAMQPLEPAIKWPLFALALALAATSYRWVETPFRRRKQATGHDPRRTLFASAAVAGLVIASAAATTRIDAGWQARFTPEVVALDAARHPLIPFQECDGHEPDIHGTTCRLGVGSGAPTVLLWGDSHALAWAPALDAVLKREGKAGLLAPNSACPPLLGVGNPVDPACHDDNSKIMRIIHAHHFEMIVLHASWASYSAPNGKYSLFDDEGHTGNDAVFPQALRRTLDALVPLTGRILLIGPTPRAPGDIPFLLAIARRFDRPAPPELSKNWMHLKTAWYWKAANRFRGSKNIELINPEPWFCDDIKCRYLDSSGELLYRDDGHLSLAGASLIADKMERDGATGK